MADPAPGEVFELPQHDGSTLRLRKLHAGWDPTDRRAAMNLVQRLAADGEIATGLLYADAQASDLHAALNTVQRPLNTLGTRELCPGAEVLARINAASR